MSHLQHPIDPLVDFAFKRIFANPKHPGVLVHFLNAVLQPTIPILQVTLVPTEGLPQYREDRVVIVDVLAKDASGSLYCVEMQRRRHGGLEQRALYSWARLVGAQLGEGSPYTSLRPVYSLWVLEEPLAERFRAPRHVLEVSEAGERPFGGMGQIVLVQPSRLRGPVGQELAPLEAWLYLFRQGGGSREVPAALATLPVMHEVFHIMSTIANDAASYLAYQRHLDAQRVEATWQSDREEAHREKEAALAALAAERRALEEERRALEEERRALEEERRAKEEAVRAQEEAVRAQEEAVRAQEEAVRAQAEAQARADALALELAELRRRLEGA